MSPRISLQLALVPLLSMGSMAACTDLSKDQGDESAATEGDGDGDPGDGDGDPGDGDGDDDPPPCVVINPGAPDPYCRYPAHCEVTLTQLDSEATVEGDLNCAIDAFINRGSASIRLIATGEDDRRPFEEDQLIYPVSDEIAIAITIEEQGVLYQRLVERGQIMNPPQYFEGCKTAGDDVAIFWCVWTWGFGCGDTTLTCEE